MGNVERNGLRAATGIGSIAPTFWECALVALNVLQIVPAISTTHISLFIGAANFLLLAWLAKHMSGSIERRPPRKLTGRGSGSRLSKFGRLTAESVEPGGWGVPLNTERNRRLNRAKTTNQIIAEIEARNRAGNRHGNSDRSLPVGCREMTQISG